MDWKKRIWGNHRAASALATLALGAAGGFAGLWLGLPLGMLVGSMVVVAVSATAQVRLFGALPGVPQNWRILVIPVIGVSIGGSVPPDVLSQLLHWWPSLLALAVFVPLAHACSYGIYRGLAKIEPNTAFFAAMPGGYIEALEMGEARGADMQMLLMLQFLRLILCIVLIPVIFTILSGHSVGSAAGVSVPGANLPMGILDLLILLGCAVFGYFGAKKLDLPAAVLMGPMVLSGIAHAVGLVEASPPGWTITVAQWIVGTSLGSRFAGLKPAKLWLAMRLSVVAMASSLGLALVFAFALARPVAEPVSAVMLAFAPGGVTEMALVAISLQLSAVYVTLSHLVRIVFAVTAAKIGMRWIEPAQKG